MTAESVACQSENYISHFPFQRPNLIMFLPLFHMHLLGRVDLKKNSVKSTRVPKMGALTEDRTESGTYSKSTKGHYLFGLFGVIFLQICYHFLAMILQKTTLNFKMIQVSSVLC